MGTDDLKREHRRLILYAFLAFAGFLIAAALVYAFAFGPTQKAASTEQFLVTPDESVSQIANDLAQKGFIRHALVFDAAYLRAGSGKIRAGGYQLSKSMDAWTIASQLVAPPYLAWVTIPVGVRKEQIADILADDLAWTDKQKEEWDSIDTATTSEYVEGVYLPGTYLILTDEPPVVIAERMREHFAEVFAPYAGEATKKKIPWTRVLTIASLIEREAGSASDMPIISGIIQRRLALGMPLAIDATLQYMSGSEENGWWPKVASAATYPDSPFNTYKRKGLPPHPIAEPSLTAIDAALHPVATDCLFYIHDPKGQIHCSPTYSGHLANINRYLK